MELDLIKIQRIFGSSFNHESMRKQVLSIYFHILLIFVFCVILPISFMSKSTSEGKQKFQQHVLTKHYFFLSNSIAPLRIYLYNLSGLNCTKDKVITKWPKKRIEMHTDIFERLIYHQIEKNSELRTYDWRKADIFGAPYFLTVRPYDKLTEILIPFINKTVHYIDRYGGVDHFFVHPVFCSHYFSIQYQEQKYLPYSLSLSDFHWFWSIDKVRYAWRTTIIPYTSNQEIQSMKKNISVFFIGTLNPAFMGGTGRKVRRAMYDYLTSNNITNSLIIKTLRFSKKGRVFDYDMAGYLRQSYFCPVPYGDSPSSKRLFDTFRARCVPIVLADEIRYPFEYTLIDYRYVVTQINMTKPSEIMYVMNAMNNRRIKQMRFEMNQIDRILDVQTDDAFKKGDQTWAWLWMEYIKAVVVSSVKRRNLLRKDY